MSLLAWYGIAALIPIGAVFYWARRIVAYGLLCTLTVLGFAAVTFPSLARERPAEWAVLVAGLGLCVFGLLIVRVMLVRSVSLRLLRSLDQGQAERMNEDIGGRLADMRGFRLIEPSAPCRLTAFGRLVGATVATLYSLLGIKA